MWKVPKMTKTYWNHSQAFIRHFKPGINYKKPQKYNKQCQQINKIVYFSTVSPYVARIFYRIAELMLSEKHTTGGTFTATFSEQVAVKVPPSGNGPMK